MKITIKQTGYYDVSWFGTEGSGSKTQFLEAGEEVEVDAERAAVARLGGASLTVKWSEQQLPHDAVSKLEKWQESQQSTPESTESAAKFMQAVFTIPEVATYFKLTAHAAATEYLRVRDAALVERCAELLDERGHRHAANSLRKMAREGKVT